MINFILVLLLLNGYSVQAAPYQPDDGNVVLVTINQAADMQQIRLLQQQLQRKPGDDELADRIVSRYIAAGRKSGDERYFSYAQAVLDKYADKTKNLTLMLHQADILQRFHRFDEALEILGDILFVDKTHVRARLMRMVIHQSRGQYRKAMTDCNAMLGHADLLVLVTCQTQLRSLQGQLKQGIRLLEDTLEKHVNDDAETLLWASTVLVEMYVRDGQWQKASAIAKQALTKTPYDYYLISVYADILLELGQYTEAIKLTRSYRHIDKLAFRQLLAERASNSKSSGLTRDISRRMQAMARYEDVDHYRLLGRYYLDIKQQPYQALKYARINWQLQREPEDALLLLRSAYLAADTNQQQVIIEWLRQTGLQDSRINRELQKHGAIAQCSDCV